MLFIGQLSWKQLAKKKQKQKTISCSNLKIQVHLLLGTFWTQYLNSTEKKICKKIKQKSTKKKNKIKRAMKTSLAPLLWHTILNRFFAEKFLRSVEKCSIHLALRTSPLSQIRWPSSSSSTLLDLFLRWLFWKRHQDRPANQYIRVNSGQNTQFIQRGDIQAFSYAPGHEQLAGAISNSVPRNSQGTVYVTEEKHGKEQIFR